LATAQPHRTVALRSAPVSRGICQNLNPLAPHNSGSKSQSPLQVQAVTEVQLAQNVPQMVVRRVSIALSLSDFLPEEEGRTRHATLRFASHTVRRESPTNRAPPTQKTVAPMVPRAHYSQGSCTAPFRTQSWRRSTVPPRTHRWPYTGSRRLPVRTHQLALETLQSGL